MSMRCFTFPFPFTTSVPTTFSLLKHLTSSSFSSSISKPPLLLLHCSLSTSMSSRPNFQGGRRGGGGNRGGGNRGGGGRGGGGRGGGGGEQRWWDPVWRAQKLAQKAAEYEVLDENEWWNKMEGFQKGGEQELIIKRLFRREDQQLLSDMAQQLGLYFHAYNKGKTLVASKVPLPNYRADLDERHGSTQKEIRMSTDIERRVGSLLDTSKGESSTENSTGASSQSSKNSLSAKSFAIESNVDKDKISAELKQQEKLKARANVQAMQSFRAKLPAFNVRTEFLNAVAKNQVLVVSGETGCGKTTQLPQFILEEEISLLRGADCSIICTQPRRISAISVAARISSERGENLGETVGYQIRLETKRSARTRFRIQI